MSIKDLLLWSMDLRNYEEEGELIDNDFEKLLRLLSKHKLLIRFYHKAAAIQPKWLSESQCTVLRLEYEKQQKLINEKIVALDELSKYAEEKKVDFVIVKGLSTYFLLGEAADIRTSTDIDILCSNHQDLVQLLEDLGYLKEEKEYPPHEYISMLRGEVKFDIHKYVPLTRYHPGLKKSIKNMDSSRTWLVSEKENHIEKDINYSDLETNSFKGITTNLTMHVFIICINNFRDYYNAVSHKKTIGITLFDFLELKLLINNEQFNKGKFIELTNEYDAWDAIRFTDVLLQHFFGITLCQTEDHIKNFPYKLTWTGVWGIPNSIESLISRSFDDINRSLFPAFISYQERLTEIDLEGYNSHILNFLQGLEISKSELHCSVSVTMPCLTSWVTDCFTLKLSADLHFGWECREDCFEPVSLTEGINVSYIKKNDRYTVLLNIPHQLIRNDTLTLCVDRWGGTGVVVTFLPILKVK